MHALTLLLPVAFGCLLYPPFRAPLGSRRDAALAAMVAAGVSVVCVTEGLSLCLWLSPGPVRIAWASLTAGAGMAAVVQMRRGTGPHPKPPTRPEPIVWVTAACIAAVLVPTFVVAAVSAPNNFDSMTYHLARVAQWVQHGTVSFYPTHIVRQLHLAPFAEYAVANAYLLAGYWRAANLVQFAAMVGSVLAASGIARELGAARRGQAVAALFVATLPMGILQASSTQTDVVAGFLVLATAHFGLIAIDPVRQNRTGACGLILSGAAAGLALLTKSTTYMLVGPLAIWFSAELVRRHRLRRYASAIAVAGVLALLINVPFAARNFVAFGHPLGPASERATYLNQTHSPAAMLSNALRDLSVNLGFPHDNPVSRRIPRFISIVTGVSNSDPRTTFMDSPFYVQYTRNEDYAGNAVSLVVALAATATVTVGWRRFGFAVPYAVCLAVACVLFVYTLKFQIWITRLEVPLFFAVAPVVGVAAGQLRSQALTAAVVAVLTLWAIPFAYLNDLRPLHLRSGLASRSPLDQSFAVRPEWEPHFQAAAGVLRESNAKSVGLFCGSNDWEFGLRLCIPADVRIDSVGVTNASKDCRSFSPGPIDAVVVMKGPETAATPWGPSAYRTVFDDSMLTVLRPRTDDGRENRAESHR